MATGKIKNPVPQIEVLVNNPTQVVDQETKVVPDGVYITNLRDENVYSFNQIHVHRYGKLIEMNILCTVKDTCTVGTFTTLFTTPLKPLYAVRSYCYGANPSEYSQGMGFININETSGNINFCPFTAIPSGNTRTFRFNIIYLSNYA